MIYNEQRITIFRISKPSKPSLNQQLQWLGSSLGLFNLRDKDNSCFRIFIELLKASKKDSPLSSDELSYRLSLSRGTIVHHLNKLKEGGLVINKQNKYMLRVDNLSYLIDELEKDAKRTFEDLRRVAKDIDEEIGF